LCAELIARERQYAETGGVVSFLKRTQTCVLRRKASSACDVDDKCDLSVELVERDLFAGDRLHGEVFE
jgi:hypothetical protein